MGIKNALHQVETTGVDGCVSWVLLTESCPCFYPWEKAQGQPWPHTELIPKAACPGMLLSELQAYSSSAVAAVPGVAVTAGQEAWLPFPVLFCSSGYGGQGMDVDA